MSHQLDSASEIKNRFVSNGYAHFVEKSSIHESLGGQNLETKEIEEVLTMAIEEACEGLPPFVKRQQIMQKDFIMNLILGH